jgi:hypothetical protein
MSRIIEHSASQEEAVVSRILVMVHKAVDEYFPSAMQANRRFTKTAFSMLEHDEDTAIVKVPEAEFPHEIPPPPETRGVKDSSPTTPGSFEQKAETGKPPELQRKQDSKAIMSDPASSDKDLQTSSQNPGSLETPPSYISHLDPLASQMDSLTKESEGLQSSKSKRPFDRGTYVLIAAIIAGLIMLAYVLLS